MSFVRADDIIRESCEQDGDVQLSSYRQREILTMDCVQNYIKARVLPDLKTIQTTLTSTGRLPFPVDYWDWNRMGTLEGDRVRVYGTNARLALFHTTDSSGNPINDKPYKPEYSIGFNYPFSGGYGGYGTGFGGYTYYADTSYALYGYGNGAKNDGHFIENPVDRSFQFASDLAGKTVLLEYITNGLNPSGETYVPAKARLCVKHYIRWQRALNNRNISDNFIERYEREFFNEYRMVMRSTVDLGILINAVRDAFKSTPKT